MVALLSILIIGSGTYVAFIFYDSADKVIGPSVISVEQSALAHSLNSLAVHNATLVGKAIPIYDSFNLYVKEAEIRGSALGVMIMNKYDGSVLALTY